MSVIKAMNVGFLTTTLTMAELQILALPSVCA